MLRTRLLLAAAALAGLATLAPASAQMAPAMPGPTNKGQALVDAKGNALYTFDKDMHGKSACTGGCATNWPPLMAAAGAKPLADWSVITRDDGNAQWAYKGKPLYIFAKDTTPGMSNGDGFLNGAWHIARP